MLDLFYLINFILLVIILLFLFSVEDLLVYLILSEFIWILIYVISIFFGLSFDSIFLVNLNLFILIISGLEFSVGLLIFFFFLIFLLWVHGYIVNIINYVVIGKYVKIWNKTNIL